jgi:hypothetical protein
MLPRLEIVKVPPVSSSRVHAPLRAASPSLAISRPMSRMLSRSAPCTTGTISP